MIKGALIVIFLAFGYTPSVGHAPLETVSERADNRPWIDPDTSSSEMPAAVAAAGITAFNIHPEGHLFAYVRRANGGANCTGGGTLITCVIKGRAEVQLGNAMGIRAFKVAKDQAANTFCVLTTTESRCTYLR